MTLIAGVSLVPLVVRCRPVVGGQTTSQRAESAYDDAGWQAMIMVFLAGGLGNQLFRYAAAYGMASRHRARLRLDLRFYENIRPPETPRTYELWRFKITGRPVNRVERVIHGFDRFLQRVDGPRRLPIPRFTNVIDTRQGFDPASASVPKHAFIDGDWQSEKYFKHVREELLREFDFKSDPTPENAAIIAQMKAGPSVCVHVRRGDYMLPHQALQAVPVSYYTNALAWMAARTDAARYFVFSDDPEWARANLPWPAGTRFVTHNTGRNDAEDLRLMSHCTHFIIANSTFSWWGAWLGQSKDKFVVAPSRWFAKPHPSEADLIPQEWVRL